MLQIRGYFHIFQRFVIVEDHIFSNSSQSLDYTGILSFILDSLGIFRPTTIKSEISQIFGFRIDDPPDASFHRVLPRRITGRAKHRGKTRRNITGVVGRGRSFTLPIFAILN